MISCNVNGIASVLVAFGWAQEPADDIQNAVKARVYGPEFLEREGAPTPPDTDLLYEIGTLVEVLTSQSFKRGAGAYAMSCTCIWGRLKLKGDQNIGEAGAPIPEDGPEDVIFLISVR